jgi:hypothetical protein
MVTRRSVDVVSAVLQVMVAVCVIGVSGTVVAAQGLGVRGRSRAS